MAVALFFVSDKASFVSETALHIDNGWCKNKTDSLRKVSEAVRSLVMNDVLVECIALQHQRRSLGPIHQNRRYASYRLHQSLA